MKVRATFERIGRNQGPIPVELEGVDVDALALDLYRFVVGTGRWKPAGRTAPGKRWVMSREVDVAVDLEDMTASVIVGGFQNAGTGTIEVIEP